MQDSLFSKISTADSLKQLILGHNAEIITVSDDNLVQGSVQNLVLSEVMCVVLILAVLVLYCSTIYRYKSTVRSVLSFPFSKFAEDNIRESTDSSVLRVLRYLSVAYVLTLVLAVSKFSENYLFLDKNELVFKYGILVALICFGLIYVYEFLFDKIMCWYNYRSDFYQALLFEKFLVCSFISVIMVPVTFATIFVGESLFIYFSLVYLFFTVLSLIYFYFKVASYFRKKKVSFLQYILYFCAVDLVPISFFYVVITRYLTL